MKLYILGNKHREYTKVMAPITFHAPKPYDKLETPTLVIRQKGEAWTNPFAVIYEPTFDEKSNNGIQSVTKLESKDVFKGFKVVSKIENKLITQYVITQVQNTSYENKEQDFSFTGTFAVITYNDSQKLQNVYIGEGLSFKNKKLAVQSKNKQAIALYVDFYKSNNKVNASENAEVIFTNN